MNILLVSKLSQYARSAFPISKYVETGERLGHRVALYGEQTSSPPTLPRSLDTKAFDYAVFVIYDPADFPDMPYLAQLLDSVPKGRRVIIDCLGRFNDTVRVEHDFNHLEKMDGHQGWEWVEGFEAVADKILQPTQKPLRKAVRSFLWHGFDPASVVKSYPSSAEAAQAWSLNNGSGKPYGMTYVGHNWQRWTQLRKLLEGVEPLAADIGAIAFAGSDWERRPDWAVQLGIQGVDVDPDLMTRTRVTVKPALPFQEMISFMSQGRFCPVVHRPLFNELRFVTNRTFATFCADTLPLLMIPPELAVSVYGPDAELLCISEDVRGRVSEMLRNPEPYWQAVLNTRKYLAEHHTFQHRFQELLAILEDKT